VELYEVKPQPEGPRTEREGGLGSSSRASLHAKTFVFDRSRLFIGSFNLDPRSAVLNTEMGIVFESSKLAGGIADWFDDNRRRLAYELAVRHPLPAEAGIANNTGGLEWIDHTADGDTRWTRDPETSALKRLLVRLLGLLPIEGQL
jgi:putative cardiolipin synthase